MKNTADLTVSLTTTSRRLHQVHETIATLLRQSVTPARVVLWISSEPYLLDEGIGDDLPDSLTRLTDRRLKDGNLSIRRTPNLGPYRKLLPALSEFGGIIVTADDDTRYPQNWLEGLLALHADSPSAVCCYRAHRMLVDDGKFADYRRWPRCDLPLPSFECFPTGKDGVLYPPDSFDSRLFDVGRFQSLAPSNDDIWFKAMTLLRGAPARCVIGHRDFPVVSVGNHLDGLYARFNLLGNDESLQRVFAAFGITPATFSPLA